jgi:phosphatidylglycerophosphatase A
MIWKAEIHSGKKFDMSECYISKKGFTRWICVFVTSFLGAGLVTKRGHGTVGSILAFVICCLFRNRSFYLISACSLFALGLICSTYLYRCSLYSYAKEVQSENSKDPKQTVIDEAFAVFLGAFLVFMESFWFPMIINFVLFRVFDIFKPFPIKQFENYMKRRDSTVPLGIMLDDLVAVAFSSAISVACCKFFAPQLS